MANHPSDDELADMGDADIDREDYPLAKPVGKPPELRLPPTVREAVRKAVEEEQSPEPPPVQWFQFTIRDMLILTAIVAFLMGLIVSISRGLSVYLMYSLFFLMMIVAWFAHGLWKSGYWQKPEPLDDDLPSRDQDGSREDEHLPPIRPAPEPLKYSVVDLFLLVAAFAFLMSLCTLLPGQHKLVNAAGIAGLCSLVGLVWFAMSESRHPMFILFWWVMFLMYLLTSAAVMVLG